MTWLVGVVKQPDGTVTPTSCKRVELAALFYQQGWIFINGTPGPTKGPERKPWAWEILKWTAKEEYRQKFDDYCACVSVNFLDADRPKPRKRAKAA